ncbi:MAG: substrate-binding domain-containing protein [Cyanobacteria bacterium P01_A01_bin.123]
MVFQQISQAILRRYLLRYPEPVRVVRYNDLTQQAWLLPSLKAIAPEVLPNSTDAEISKAGDASRLVADAGLQPSRRYYHQYACEIADPLNCGLVFAAGQQNPQCTACSICGFPAFLPEGKTIIGRLGTYRIQSSLGRRGLGRLYTARQSKSEQQVTIKQYLLPGQYFSAEEQRERQAAFVSLAGLNLADGRQQALRVIRPIEAIADQKTGQCYLVTPIEDAQPTLNQQLKQGPWTAIEVRQFLDQTLQTLVGLHEQRFSLPLGQLQAGITHGNVQLESCLMVVKGAHRFIYLTDVTLWEQLFDPTRTDPPPPQPQADLEALGYTAFYLLQGAVVDGDGNVLSPNLDLHWLPVHPPLKQFILQLVNSDRDLPSATAARNALLKIPPEPTRSQYAAAAEIEPQKSRRWLGWVGVLVAALLLATVGTLIWLLVRSRLATVAAETPPVCCLDAVGAAPEGTFLYTSVVGDGWARFWIANRPVQAMASANQSENSGPELEDPASTPTDSTQAERVQASTGQLPTLVTQLRQGQPTFQLVYQPSQSFEMAIAAVQQGQAAFAVLPLTESIPEDLQADVVAYDGLVAFVAFNAPTRSRGLPNALRGQITQDQLVQLYTGELTDWQKTAQVTLPLQLYLPEDPSAITLFGQRILQTPAQIAAYEAYIPQTAGVLPPLDMLRTIIKDFEVRTVGSIGFAPLSTIASQCSIYPLAIQIDRETSIQPMRLRTGEPISPDTNLCARKGSYGPDSEAFRQEIYPLAYPIAVVYARDNRRPKVGAKFTELLRTVEGQEFLQQAGFVPWKAIPELPADADAQNESR